MEMRNRANSGMESPFSLSTIITEAVFGPHATCGGAFRCRTSGLLRLLLADLEEQAIELSKDVAPRSLLVVSPMRRTDGETGAGSRIENAMSFTAASLTGR